MSLNDRPITFTPRDIDDVHLAKMNHAEWLEEFSKILALSTGVRMTPKREGMITRLYWASRYVRLLERTLEHHDAERAEALRRLQTELAEAKVLLLKDGR